jgi:YegS/Rv2252/BmrU family lipid kinase
MPLGWFSYNHLSVKQVLFIVNPHAGTGGTKAFETQIAGELDPRLFETQIAYTRYPGHGTELAADAARRGVDIVAAVGGDGSVNEVAQGLLGSSSVLAVVPKGSGNGLARMLGISRRTSAALAVIQEGALQTIDVGEANGHLFLSNAGVGFDALVARLFAGGSRRGLGAYTRQVLRALRHYHPETYTLRTEKRSWETTAFLVTVANGSQFGYNFKIVAGARPDDGILDACIMRPFPTLALPAVSLAAWIYGLAGTRYASHVPCRELRIAAARPLEWMQIDGDPVPVAGGTVRIRIRPSALQVLALQRTSF